MVRSRTALGGPVAGPNHRLGLGGVGEAGRGVGQLQDGQRLPRALQDGALLLHATALALRPFQGVAHDPFPGRQVDDPVAVGMLVERLLDGGRVVLIIVGDGTELAHIEHASVLGEGDRRLRRPAGKEQGKKDAQWFHECSFGCHLIRRFQS
jgi:hypothetical protein